MRGMAPVTAMQLAGNALLLWLGYYWLGLGESRASALLWSLLVALFILGAASWLHGATLVYFSVAERRLARALRITLPRLALLVPAAIVLLAIYFLLARWAAYSPQPAFSIASYLTNTFRRPVKPSTVLSVFNVLLWLVRWMIVPVLALPALAAIVTRRWRRPSWLYWIETPVLVVCAMWLPWTLLRWTPHVGSFGMQMFSFAARLAIAYSLFVAGWLALEFLTSGGSPRETQSNTTASP